MDKFRYFVFIAVVTGSLLVNALSLPFNIYFRLIVWIIMCFYLYLSTCLFVNDIYMRAAEDLMDERINGKKEG